MDKPRTIRWIASAVLMLAVALSFWIVLWRFPAQPASPATRSVTDSGSRPLEPVPSVTQAEQANQASPLICAEQEAQVVQDGVSGRYCLSTTRSRQVGSVRSYVMEPRGKSRKWLRLDMAGSSVLAVSLGEGPTADFKCERGQCSGVTVSRPDGQGVRSISLAGVRLSSDRPAPAHQDPGELLLTAQLTVSESRRECSGQSVSISTSDGSVQSFCAEGGVGFELREDGRRTYRFTSLEGGSILAVVDTERRVSSVEYDDEGHPKCVAPSCVGVAIAPLGSEGALRFVFSGTVLQDPVQSAHTLTLNGALDVPLLE